FEHSKVGEVPFLGGPRGSKPCFLVFLGHDIVLPNWARVCPRDSLWRFVLGRGCRLRILSL
ncbi:hypothetical protein A2U01_0086782, partial [Trifolium medium]|nr:hypothetical protein [Trifolium medium]